ncbi:hypothetical protein SAMN05216176_12519 [Nitratireductor indicus]|uniref:hypothetical protein n=1 Tax=Nitratireductor indicus TaxID=721133 RepID=UPI0008E82B2D|nr:hypothetical protein [Nitratireductor indicus]SFQ81913.1 hypothetical protein SAMN05216176_12519 [Nitratireductor indicus]
MSSKRRRWTLDQVLRSGNVTDVVLVKLDHTDGPVYLWNGLGLLDHDGVEWRGVGRLGSVKLGAADTEVKINDVVFALSGIDEEYVSYLDSTVKGSKGWVWKAFMGPDYQVRFTELLTECELDQPSFSIEPNGTASMTVAANGGFYFLEIQSRAYWDTEEQRNYLTSLGLDPDSDTGFDMMSQLKNLTLAWEPPD